MSKTTPCLDTKWDLSEEEVHSWIRTLRILRQDAREKIQPFVDGPATVSDLARMRVEVCEFIVDKLAPLLEEYWKRRLQRSSKRSQYQYDFFFSPGYRPYGRNRVPLEVVGETQSRAVPEHIQHLLALGRHSHRGRESKELFALAPWMHYVYEQRIGACKIGGFTDWFAQFDRIKIDASDETLIAFAIRGRLETGDGDSSTMQCVNGVARFNLPMKEKTGGAVLLDDFEALLRKSLDRFTFLGKTGTSARKSISPQEIVPYPPAYIWRDESWLKVDLTNLPVSLSSEEQKELKLARERFAWLFESIFRPCLLISGCASEDETMRRVFRELDRKEIISYPYYHVFLTDQDLSLEHKRSDGATRIGSKLGTLNLFTPFPLCDVGLGLIRDTLEAVYDSVRDAEVLTEYARVHYHEDATIDLWVRAYCEPWHSSALEAQAQKPWNHDEIDRLSDLKPYVGRICSDLLGGFRLLNAEDKQHFAKALFQTEGISKGKRVHREDRCDVNPPDSMRYFVTDDIAMIAEAVRISGFEGRLPGISLGGGRWYPPVIPGFVVFMALRNLVQEMLLANSPPEEVTFGCDLDFSWIGVRLRPSRFSEPRAHEARFREKSGNGLRDPLTGLSGAVWRAQRCCVDIQEPARRMAEQSSLSLVPLDVLGGASRLRLTDIVWGDYSIEFRWRNPKTR